MRRLWLLLGLVGALCVVIAVCLWLSQSNLFAEVTPEADPITTFSASQVTDIQYTYEDQAIAYHYDADAQTWQWADDPDFPLDSSYLTAMTEALAQLVPLRTVEGGDQDAFGLDDPMVIELTLSDGSSVQCAIGAYNEAAGGYYLTLGDDGTVYLVESAAITPFLYTPAELILMDQPPSIASTDITGFKLAVNGQTYTGQYNESGHASCYTDAYTWLMNDQPIDAASIRNMLSQIINFTPSSCELYQSEKSGDYGLDTPLAVLDLDYESEESHSTVDENGETTTETETVKNALTITIGAASDENHHYLTFSGSDQVFTVADSTLEPLLNFDPSAYDSANVCLITEDMVLSFEATLSDGTHYTFEPGQVFELQEDGTYEEVDGFLCGDQEVSNTALAAWFESLNQLEAETLTDAADDPEAEVFLTLTFQCQRAHFTTQTLEILSEENGFCRVRFNGRSDQLVSWRDVQKLAEDLSALAGAEE